MHQIFPISVLQNDIQKELHISQYMNSHIKFTKWMRVKTD